MISPNHPRIRLDADGCWVATTKGTPDGYCYLTFNGSSDYAHRHSYRQHVGEIPVGYEIDHLCRNRACCNPAHLEAVPAAENRRRAHATRYDHDATGPLCVNGHEWASTARYAYSKARRRSVRYCATCKVEGARARRRANRQGRNAPDRRKVWAPVAAAAAALALSSPSAHAFDRPPKPTVPESTTTTSTTTTSTLPPVSTTSTLPPEVPSSTAAPSTTLPPASVSTVPPTTPTTTTVPEVLVTTPPVPRPTTGSTVPPPSLPVVGGDLSIHAWFAGIVLGIGFGMMLARRIGR